MKILSWPILQQLTLNNTEVQTMRNSIWKQLFVLLLLVQIFKQ